MSNEPYEDAAQQYLTPSKEEQTFLILSNKCPHNKGWVYLGHGHNDEAYACALCGHVEFY